MAKVRLYDLMKKFNVGFETLVDFLIDKGESMPNPTINTKVPDSCLEELGARFGTDVKLKNASNKVITRLHAIKETVTLPPDKRLVALTRIPKIVDDEPYVPKHKRKTRTDKQEEYNLKYLDTLKEIEKIERKSKGEISPLTATAKHRLQKLYKTRKVLENSIHRFKSFIKANPGYEDLAIEVEKRRASEIEAQQKRAEEAKEEKRRKRLLKRQQAAKEKSKSATFNKSALPITDAKIRVDLDVTIKVKWDEVFFYDKKLEIKYAGQAYSIYCPESCYAYNSIISSFANRLAPIEVRISKSKAIVVNKITFDDIIMMLHFHNNLFHIDGKGGRTFVDIRRLSNIPKDILNTFFPLDKTNYLTYLQERQAPDIRYLPVFESGNDSPDGFLFTIKSTSGYLLVWESTDDRTHKSTYVFEAAEDELINLQQLLFDYIISDIGSKRLNLRNNRVKEFGGFSYSYIDHDFFPTWRNKFEHILNKKSTVLNRIKNEAIVVYENKTPIVLYEPVHNIVQNSIKNILEESNMYSHVLLESDHVDIKALTTKGLWHFFEIKTSKTKKCLREALGQILEYAHFKPTVKTEKLFIVGLYKMSDTEKQYIRLLRNLYNIPIWYIWFDEENMILHQPKDS